MFTQTVLVLAATAAAVAPPAVAPRDPAAAGLVAGAIHANPAVEAARWRWQAAHQRAAGEGLLPDPMLGASIMNLPTLQGPQVTAAQTFPLGPKLGLARRLADQEGEVARLAYLNEANRVGLAVASAYYDVLSLRRAASIVQRTKELSTRMSRVATARYAVGTGKQGDPLRANVQVAELLHEGLQLRQRLDAARSRLRGLVGAKAEAGLPANPDLPGGAARLAVPTHAATLAAAEARNPMLREARAMVTSGELALEAAGASATPDLSAQVGVGRAYMDMGWMNALSAMVGINLPFPNGLARRDAAVAGAQAELAARQATLADRRRQVQVEAEEALGHLHHLGEQLRLYERGILPLARQALAAELANYQTGRSDFDAWLAAQAGLYRYEREAYEALAEHHKTRAALDALTGATIAGLEDAR